MKTIGANDILGSLSPASLPDRAITYGVDLAKSIYRLILRRIEQTPEDVSPEYYLLHWQTKRLRKACLNARDSHALLASPERIGRRPKINAQVLRISAQKYYQYCVGGLGNLIAAHCGDVKGILHDMEREGRIRIIARERMPFAPSINNDGFLYCWEPT